MDYSGREAAAKRAVLLTIRKKFVVNARHSGEGLPEKFNADGFYHPARRQ
jgi:hypothetical protein